MNASPQTPPRHISRVLIANRGEIAVRILRACHALNIEAVVVYSAADAESLAVRLADRSICIGPPPAAKSYLQIDTLLHAAMATGCQAIHPGYGFLSEREAFARRCVEEGLIFIGPSAQAIAMMGDKIAARAAAVAAGVPTLPGSSDLPSASEAEMFAETIGYPLLLKASAGGGGRGMKIVRQRGELKAAFDVASAEANAAFGNGTLYMERYVENARHIEVQVLGDCCGKVIHIGERDCSLQRRHQKLVEEAPAPFISVAIVDAMRASAVGLARSVRYENAGTVEFIFDCDRNEFYFLEMNTRIQVEHPVTEEISGLDLVKEQIRIAQGAPLQISQDDLRLSGHAVEVRINAEAPLDNFRPSPGRISEWRTPEAPGIRVDTHCYTGYVVPPFYDSMIAKIIARAPTRDEALDKLEQALGAMVISGITTTAPFVRALLNDSAFRAGDFSTGLIEQRLRERAKTAA